MESWLKSLLSILPEPVKSDEGISVFIPYIQAATNNLINDAEKHSKVTVVLNEVDIKKCIDKVGNEAFIAFKNKFSLAASPIISKSFNEKFDTKFKDIDKITEGDTYKSGDFTYMIIEVNKPAGKVKIADMMYNSVDDMWESNKEGAFYIDIFKLASDYEQVKLN